MVAAVLELATQPVGGRCSTRCIPYSTSSPDLSDPGLQPRPGRHCARPRRYRLPAVAIGLPIVCRNPAPLSLSSFHSFCETFPPKMSVGFIPNLSPPLPLLGDLFHSGYFFKLVQFSCYTFQTIHPEENPEKYPETGITTRGFNPV